ncbi:MAG: ParB N-terminal domain-containing protein [Chloroflexi bacterium]|nr:ParB N-terminal domain-containing protein [Chloroflexota bacterium]
MDITKIIVGDRHRRDLGDIEALAASIEAVGLLHPIVVDTKNNLIAGERRITACNQLGWDDIPVTVIDLVELVKGEFAENAMRKDFLPSEINAIRKAMEPIEKAAAKERMSEGGKVGKVSTPPGKARDKIGSMAGVSGRTVEKIAKVVEAVETDPEQFGGLVEEMDKTGKVDAAYRKVQRARKVKAIAEKTMEQTPLNGHPNYPVIYADPPWQNVVWGADTGHGKSPENHYDTMTLDDIKALPIPAEDDAVLFMWTTANRAHWAMVVLASWGFEYRTQIVWDKVKIGTGRWVRDRHELLYIAVKGKGLPAPSPGDQPDSVLAIPKGKHSAKPEEFRAIIDACYPGVTKLEMFHRGDAPDGWDVWGNETTGKAA